MSRLSRALSSLVQDLREPHGRLQMLENERNNVPGEWKTLEHRDAQTQRSASAQSTAHAPTSEETLNHLGRLADDYHLPRKLVYATADAESGLDVNKISPNVAHDKRGHAIKDKLGQFVVNSTDYGLMQINSSLIGHEVVRDASGHKMKITDAVTKDWKANAEAGVAILKHDYDLGTLSTPPGASAEDVALATYAAYNHGASHWHKFLEKDKNGAPTDGGVRNFHHRYTSAPDR